MKTNPLLSPLKLTHGEIPFTEIQNDHFLPALENALSDARKRLEEIKTDPSPPDFENTLVALETCGERVDLVASVFSNLLHAHTNDVLQELAKEIMPKLAEYSNDISLDAKLFERVKSVYEYREKLQLSSEQVMLLEKTYKFFVRNGALLDEKAKARLREIDKRSSVLSQQFGDNVLKSTNRFELVLTNKSDLAGLPESAVEAASLAARERGKEGAWVFTLHAPSYLPFLKFSEKRELREKIWRAVSARGTEADADNRPIARELASLRHERAKLLGYDTHAHFVLEERMASAPETVKKFLERLLGVSRKAAERDLDELKTFSGLTDFNPWDFAFYTEKLKHQKFNYDEEELRPYFKLENVAAGVFEHARRLYGLVFEPRMDVPVYHPDVKAYEVKDEQSGKHVGLFYADFFPRASKQSGAWMTTFRDQGLFEGEVRRPHVSIVCNLTKPTETKPSLLTLNDVRTVFHEFGHALHALLSDCSYRSMSGTNVYWDFVELPSQIMENWVNEKDSLALFARHYETGEVIPDKLISKIKENARFQAGTASLRQLGFGFLDISWHAADPTDISDVEEHEVKAMQECSLFPHVPGAIISCSFSHIFAGGYSSGYYSYKWAEVLDADAFEYFKEKGLFSKDVAEKFRKHILARGGTEHPMELYKKFRGREPDPDALLRRDGLLS